MSLPPQIFEVVWRGGGSCWPTLSQRLLLQAALLGPETALPAWERWKDDAPIREIDPGSFRLFPLLYHNLSRFLPDDEWIPWLKLRYLEEWSRNKIFVHRSAAPIRLLSSHKIPLLILKGAALGPSFYAHPALRPMSDLDFLVRPEDAPQAIHLLQEAGWRSQHDDPLRLLAYTSSNGFRNEAGDEMDLHWHVLHECCRTGDDDDFWEASLPFVFAGEELRMLHPSDQLLHICSHGLRWNSTPPLRWMADSFQILRKEGEGFDWARLLGQARSRNLTLPLYEGLSYLKEHLVLPIPETFLEDLNQTPVSCGERLEFKSKKSVPGLLGPLFLDLCFYRRWAAEKGFWKGLAGCFDYLAVIHNRQTSGQILRHFFFVFWKQLGQKFSGTR